MSASAAAKARPGRRLPRYSDCRNLIDAARCRSLPPGFVAPKITVATRAPSPAGDTHDRSLHASVRGIIVHWRDRVDRLAAFRLRRHPRADRRALPGKRASAGPGLHDGQARNRRPREQSRGLPRVGRQADRAGLRVARRAEASGQDAAARGTEGRRQRLRRRTRPRCSRFSLPRRARSPTSPRSSTARSPTRPRSPRARHKPTRRRPPICPAPNSRNSITTVAPPARCSPAIRKRSPTGSRRSRSARTPAISYSARGSSSWSRCSIKPLVI